MRLTGEETHDMQVKPVGGILLAMLALNTSFLLALNYLSDIHPTGLHSHNLNRPLKLTFQDRFQHMNSIPCLPSLLLTIPSLILLFQFFLSPLFLFTYTHYYKMILFFVHSDKQL